MVYHSLRLVCVLTNPYSKSIASFITIGATISHALIYLRKPTLLHFRTSLEEQPDIHARLMAGYPKGTCRNL